MKYIQLTQGYQATVSDEDYEWLNQWKWCIKKTKRNTFYAKRGDKDGKTIMMHRAILGVTNSKIQIDHNDGNGLNNQRSNLRESNHSQNQANRSKKKESSSKYLGVNKHKRYGWVVSCQKDKKQYKKWALYEVEAAVMYNQIAKQLHGEYAKLNIITEEDVLEYNKQKANPIIYEIHRDRSGKFSRRNSCTK